jgi:hypothetical protein
MDLIVWVEMRLGGQRLEIREVAKVEREATGIGPLDPEIQMSVGNSQTHSYLQRLPV